MKIDRAIHRRTIERVMRRSVFLVSANDAVSIFARTVNFSAPIWKRFDLGNFGSIANWRRGHDIPIHLVETAQRLLETILKLLFIIQGTTSPIEGDFGAFSTSGLRSNL